MFFILFVIFSIKCKQYKWVQAFKNHKKDFKCHLAQP